MAESPVESVRDAVAIRFSTIPDSPVSPFHATINNRLQLMSRALGRAYIAFCPPNERNLLLRMLATSVPYSGMAGYSADSRHLFIVPRMPPNTATETPRG
jgi:hypothetical protein